MISYRFKRRAFITALSGGVGLKIMLRNSSCRRRRCASPARLLVTHWPVGIVAGSGNALWTPTSGSVGGSPGLKPFADAGLGPDMTVMRGISTPGNLNGGGSHEGGTVVLVTGVSCGGTRTNRTEGDDGYRGRAVLRAGPAEGRHGAQLAQGPGAGYANSIADSRTDFAEVSTKCLSYSSNKQNVTLYSGGTAQENIPLTPVLSPLTQYTNLFGNFVPTAAAYDDGQTAAAPADDDADQPRAPEERPRLRDGRDQPAQGDGSQRRAQQAPEPLRRHLADGAVGHEPDQLVVPRAGDVQHGHGRHGRQHRRCGRPRWRRREHRWPRRHRRHRRARWDRRRRRQRRQRWHHRHGRHRRRRRVQRRMHGEATGAANRHGQRRPDDRRGQLYGRDSATTDDMANHATAGKAAPRRAQGGVRVRPDSHRHLPVVAGHQPRRVQGSVPGRGQHDLPAPPGQPPHRHPRHDRRQHGGRARRSGRVPLQRSSSGTSRAARREHGQRGRRRSTAAATPCSTTRSFPTSPRSARPATSAPTCPR